MQDAAPPQAKRPLRLLIGKVGLDGHDRGAKIIARALRDAGHEVIYTGLHQTPEQVVETAIQEDVDGVGLSSLSGAHLHLFGKVLELLRQRDAGDVTLFGGGIIPEEDLPRLLEMGVRKVFRPGTTTEEILRFLDEGLAPRSESR
jgi:methylmalonyl-CoA mutase C-terminal domain/subunit